MTETSAATASGSDLTASITINATPQQVWAAISDVTRMPSWSPQVRKTIIRGSGAPGLGTKFVNINRDGWKHWPTTARIVRCDPYTQFAFRVNENRTIWSFTLEEADGGTRVTQRRETPEGISQVSHVMVKVGLGGQEPFTAMMRRGMEETLQRLKADLEG
ncbi:MAG: SRPBCC family protein [Streptosporangiales bacterium]|nr:SRPBCC family protein [Streptosporangiales bacterium]